ncbi:hypothetical protein CYLTODRAFT_460342 [Cylindrobasidium torrendii FP15055 ss-10]|uniref:Uncharacterized protein n=1 Tax=Cylindrobasidium torrendii FP15055 ss-10 TaxID=1314674 RepID=A0A0D7AR94_9AGAR|nr:hypothetical protein CYLTODRAFT_460342 [Cylindrobasidium torrendii FP15055 ss-10]
MRFNSQEGAFACLPFIQGICGGPPENPFPLFREAQLIDTAFLCTAIKRQLEVESNIHFFVDLSQHEFVPADFDGAEMAPRDSLVILDALPALEHHISSSLLKYMEQNPPFSKTQFNATLNSLVDSTERHGRAARLAGGPAMPSRYEMFEGYIPDTALIQENAADIEFALSQSENRDQRAISEGANEAEQFDIDHLGLSKTEIPKWQMDLVERARRNCLMGKHVHRLLDTLGSKRPLVKQWLIINGVLTESSVEPSPLAHTRPLVHDSDNTTGSPSPTNCANDAVESAPDEGCVVQEENIAHSKVTTSSGSSQVSTRPTPQWPKPHSDTELQKALSEILSGSVYPRTRSRKNASQSSFNGAACKKAVQDYFVFGIDAVNATLSKCKHSDEVIAVLVMGMEEHTECQLLSGLYDCILEHATRLPSLKLAIMPEGSLKLFPRDKMRRRTAEDAVVLIKDGKDQVLRSLKTHTQHIISRDG